MTKQFHDFQFQGWKRNPEGRSTRVDDNGPLVAQLRKVQTHGFPEAAFDPIADIGASQSARSGESNASTLRLILPQVERGEVGAGVAFASIVDKPEVAGS